METTLQGKVCLVTGSTAGIGEVTARTLAGMGATVIGVGRNPPKSAAVAERIKSETGNPAVEYLIADLSSQAQVRDLAEAFKQKYNRLDVLVNNAGAFYSFRQESVDGIEMTFALDHLSYFLLTNLLLDTIKASVPSRIINVSSDAHQRARIYFDDLQFHAGYGGFGFRAYGQSKLANVLFTYELARRLEGTGVTANALHPGFVATNFGHNNRSLIGWGTRIVQKFTARTPEKGAETSIYLATSPEVEGVTGKYFVDQKVIASSPESYDEAVANRLWEVSAEMTRLQMGKKTL